jgi:hypothetical protein
LDPDTHASLIAIWARDRLGLTPAEYATRTQCYKRLSMLWDDPDIAAAHPDAANGAKWDQSNTVLVDDSLEKARAQPHNLVQIPKFDGQPNDDVLPQVQSLLDILASQADVSRYLRRNPFMLAPRPG